MRLLHDTRLMAVLLPEVDRFLGRDKGNGVLWRCLESLDSHGDGECEPAPALIFGAMLCPVFMSETMPGSRTRRIDVARALVDQVAERFRMPKRLCSHLVHVLDAQQRLDSSGGRFSKTRFMAQGYFADALALREIYVAGAGTGRRALDVWHKRYREYLAGQRPGAGPRDQAPPPRRRPSRRRGRRGGRRGKYRKEAR
jgi:hypothetical protein